jgi:predicted permease
MKGPRLPRIPWLSPRADVDDELRFHIEMAAADLVAGGMHPDAARAEAERRFGHVTDIRDAVLTIDERRRRGAARADFMSAIAQDIRFALRSFRKTPMLTAATTITLMLGVGATTAMFSVVNGVLLRPLPYAHVDRLVALSDAQEQDPDTPFAYPEVVDWQQRGGDVFEKIGAWWNQSLTLTSGPEPLVVRGQRMSSTIPDLLGVHPIIGRNFVPDEDSPTGTRAVMLSSDFWKRHFNGDTGIVGKTLEMAGFPFLVVGVFPSTPQSRVPDALTDARGDDVWWSLRLDESRAPRSLHFLRMMARVKPGLTREAVNARIARVNDQLHRDSVTQHSVSAVDLSTKVIGPARAMLGAIFAAVLLVLFVACANVANLLLARASSRQREVAIRSALGAGRKRIVTQLLVESVMRAVVGGVLGIALAYAAVGAVRGMPGLRLPRFSETSIDWRVMLFALALSILTGIAFGIVPALRATGDSTNSVMRDGARGVAGSLRHDALRRTLMIGELVMSFVLLGCAGLLLRSFDRLMHVPKGFSAEHVVTGAISLPGSKYGDGPSQVAFWSQLLDRVRAVPGVSQAGVTSGLPVLGGANGGINIAGRTYTDANRPIADKRFASAGYFPSIGAQFRRGRDFSPADVATSQQVAIVNEQFVKKFFPGEDPIGKQIDFLWDTKGLQTIVGVVADVREGALNAPISPSVYVPITQRPDSYMYLTVRSTIDELSIVPALRKALHELDSNVPLADVRTLDEAVSSRVTTEKMTTALLVGFAVLTLVLAAIGLYGVISYSVAQRTQELGVRAALGAQKGELLAGVFREGMSFVLVGLVIGGIAARAASQLISARLFGVTPGDPVVFTAVAGLLVAVAVLALLLPAMRAARVDPIVALREGA